MSSSTQHRSTPSSALQILAAINQLSLQAYTAANIEILKFKILNETQQLLFYNRAMLCVIRAQKRAEIIGISGQTTVNKKSELIELLQHLLKNLKELDKIKKLDSSSFSTKASQDWTAYSQEKTKPNVCWVPLYRDKTNVVGLWLERWQEQPSWFDYEIELLGFLSMAYGAAWRQMQPKWTLQILLKFPWHMLAMAMTVACLFIHVPLRVVAPCEIAAKQPIIATAPLDGVIAEVMVKNGDYVQQGQLLFSYQKMVLLQNLSAQKNELQYSKAQLDRAVVLSQKRAENLAQIAGLTLQVEKQKAIYDLMRYQTDKLDYFSPRQGTIVLDDAEQWRGRPTAIGEKILLIADQKETKIKIWIPESDNITLHRDRPIKIILNIHPDKTLFAKVSSIASYSRIDDRGVPSFLAEAQWIEDKEYPKLGLKGTAVLYGEKVTLLYWIVRRPWTVLRNFIGF